MQQFRYSEGMKTLYERYRYELIAACAGGIVMVLELVGARMVAPYFGTSIYVWTAMIGVILGALALGYGYGGKWADQQASDKGLALLLIIAAAIIFVSIVVQAPVLNLLASVPVDIRLQTLVAAVVLFGPASFFLGVVSPYVVKLRLSSLETAGQSVGRLYAAGTLGSIIGTFLAGYFLIDWFGNRTLGLGLVLLLLAVSFMSVARPWRWQRLALLAAVGIFMVVPVARPEYVTADIDSPYSRYQVLTHPQEDGLVRSLVTDRFGTQSAVLLGQPDVAVFDYIDRFQQIYRSLQPSRALVIGGGTYTFPAMMAHQYPEATVTAVEIDPKLTDVAREYFELDIPDNLSIVHADGRVYLNRAEERYQAVYVDAFSSMTPPFHLATKEATHRMKDALSEDGVVVANIIAPRQPTEYLQAVVSTSRQAFRFVDAYAVDQAAPADEAQNLIVVMTNDTGSRRAVGDALSSPSLVIGKEGRILTDDHAPIEQLIHR